MSPESMPTPESPAVTGTYQLQFEPGQARQFGPVVRLAWYTHPDGSLRHLQLLRDNMQGRFDIPTAESWIFMGLLLWPRSPSPLLLLYPRRPEDREKTLEAFENLSLELLKTVRQLIPEVTPRARWGWCVSAGHEHAPTWHRLLVGWDKAVSTRRTQDLIQNVAAPLTLPIRQAITALADWPDLPPYFSTFLDQAISPLEWPVIPVAANNAWRM